MFLHDCRAETLPPEVLHEGKRSLLDLLSLAVGAAGEPAATVAGRVAQSLGGEPQAGV